MTRLLEILISMAIVAVLFVLVALFLPSSRTITEQIETNRRQSIVFDTLNSLRRFDDWNALPMRDPAARLSLSGPESGVGARLDYESDERSLGEGSWEIVESEPDSRVVYALETPDRGENKRMEFQLQPTGRGGRNMEITQTYHVDYGWNLLGRYAGMYVRGHVGEDMKLGLSKLASMLAAVPNVDYRADGVRLTDLGVVDTPAENLLSVSAGAVERNNEVIKDSMKSNTEWIKRTMDANDLEPVGPLRIVSTELGRENYTFDVVQAVRRKGAGTPGDDDENEDEANGDEAEGEDAAPTVAQAPAVDEGELKVEIPGGAPVEYIRVEAGKAARGEYVGYMAELENVRNAVRAWALTHGYEVTDRPFEYYNNGIDEAFTENGEFEVFWRLKE
ncbi:SRPBCC family protein [Luteimonas kalidii]|uniref:Polyketide cyclase n=1 Tax=Luteimonas kalidii TaxID=3042025 RepID=A0ABT6JW15_9GAMM|nr:SRPBCC family protein [Luteimonas kalidii]MDH5834888.1 polyketide cyclase [Luteimonas kalidii]